MFGEDAVEQRHDMTRRDYGRTGVVLTLLGVALAAVFLLLLAQDSAVAQVPATTVPGDEAEPSDSPPTIRSNDTEGLVDGQRIVVNGQGYGDGHGGIVVMQCVGEATSVVDCDPGSMFYPNNHSRNGRWRTEVAVQRVVDAPRGSVDCAERACGLALIGFGESIVVFDTLALSFDPAVPATTQPEASARPRQNLVDRQVVTVKVSGLLPFTEVSLMQCSNDGPVAGSCGGYGNVRAEVDGTGTGEIEVVRIIDGYGGVVDCAEQTCKIFMSNTGRSAAPISLKFDPDAAPPEAPTVKVTPRRGLVDGDRVMVEIERIETDNPHFYFSIAQCGMQDGQPVRSECRYLGDGGGHGEEPVPDSPATTFAPSNDGVSTTIAPSPPDAPPATEPELEPPTTEPPSDVPPPPPGDPEAPVEVMLRRVIRLGHGENVQAIDCGESAGRCAIVVEFDTGTRAVSKPLVFDASEPPAKPNVVMTNANKLVAGNTHRIKIDNYLGRWVEVRQCPRDATSHEDPRCRILFYDGRWGDDISRDRFTVAVRPVRTVGNDPVVDCYDRDACDFRVFGEDGPMRRVLINFDADAESPPSNMQVRPKRKLVDGQQVRVKIRNLEADLGFFVSQCIADTSSCVGLEPIDVKQNGSNVSIDVFVQRFVGSVDCAAEPKSCIILSWSERDGEMRVPLRFTKTKVEPIKINVSPRKGLVDRQKVDVTAATGANANGMYVRQCVADSEATCGNARYLNNRDGTPTARATVRRVLRGVDCAEKIGRCEIRLFSGDIVRGSKRLVFDAEVPIPEPLELDLKVSPTTNLAPVQLVEAEVSGADGWFNLAQCAVIDGTFAPGSCRYVDGVRRQPNGVQTTSFIVQRMLMPPGATTGWDCAAVPESCVVALIDNHSATEPLLSVPLTFDPDAEVPVPEVSVTPTENLVDGQVVTVSGTGYFPRFSIFIVQCAGQREEASVDNCNLDSLNPVVTTEDGSFSRDIVVVDSVNGLDCRDVECWIGAGDASLSQTAVSERLFFS